MKSWGPRMRWAAIITMGLTGLVAVFMVWAGAQWQAKVNELRTVTPLSDEELIHYKRSLARLANELGVSQMELVDFGKVALSIGPRGREGFDDIVRGTQVAHVVLGLTKQEASTFAAVVVRDLGFAPSKLMNFTNMLRAAQSEGMTPQESIRFLAGISDSFSTMRANYGWNEETMDRAITGFMGTAMALHAHGTK